jgi:membrane protein DedA with SNARE-associated domain
LDEPTASPAGDPVDPPRTHPGPPSVLARNVVVGAALVLIAASYGGGAFLPVLSRDHPLLLIVLTSNNRSLALASGDLSWMVFYSVGFIRLVLPDPLFFLLGRWYGDSAIHWLERRAPTYGQLFRSLEGFFGKAKLAVVAFAPNLPVSVLAGASGMGAVPFYAANVIGTVVRLWLVRTFSGVFADLLESFKDFIGEYRLPLLAVSISAVAFSIWSERRTGKIGIGDLVHLDEELAAADAEAEADGGAPPT